MADFTTVMTGTAQVDDSIISLYEAQFLVAAAEMGVMDQFVSYRQNIGAKSIEMPKYDQLALATTALPEREDISSVAISDSKIIITPAEYGSVVTTTLLANLQTGGKADLASARLVGMNAQRTLDKLAILAGEATSNILTPANTAEGGILAGHVMSVSFLNKLYNKLSRSNVMPLSNGMFVAVLHDDQIHDLRDSATAGSWTDINKYSSPDMVLKNEVGSLGGFRIVRDNLITINTDGGDGTVDTYRGLFLGFNALGKAESSPLRQTITGPFDKLGRFVNYGWHSCVGYKIVDSDAIYMGITASSVGNNA